MTTNGDTPTSCFASRCSSRIRDAVRRRLTALVAAAYPPRCLLCGRELRSLDVLCADCVTSLPAFEGPRCERCGEPLVDASTDLCLRCGTHAFSVDRIVSLGPYHRSWGALVRAFKFDREIAVGRWLGRRLADAPRALSPQSYDVVTYVPMTRKDRRERGFNQARVLAREVARTAHLPVRRLLVKTRETSAQRLLTARDRHKNLREAFRPIPSAYSRVLLVDDIYTTGATVEECARTLKRGGAEHVVALTVARA